MLWAAAGRVAAFLLPMLTARAAGWVAVGVVAWVTPAARRASLAATTSTAVAATDLRVTELARLSGATTLLRDLGVTELARVIGATTLVTRFLAEWATLEVALAVACVLTLSELLANLAATVEAMLRAEPICPVVLTPSRLIKPLTTEELIKKGPAT